MENGYIGPDGKLYQCGFSEHAELGRKMLADGLIDIGQDPTDDPLSFTWYGAENIATIIKENGFIHVQFGVASYGNYHKECVISITDEQKKVLKELGMSDHIENLDFKLVTSEFLCRTKIGTKAQNLVLLKDKHIKTKPFVILPLEFVEMFTIDDIANYVNINKPLAVRSSGHVSMPGLLETVLNVSKENLNSAISIVDSSWNSSDVKLFLESSDMEYEKKGGIIIQEMVDTLRGGAGVIRVSTIDKDYGGWNPTFDIQGEFVTGETGSSLVSGYSTSAKKYENLPPFVKKHLLSLIERVMRYTSGWKPQEIEFAWEGEDVYLLQTRDWIPVKGSKGTCAYPGKVKGQIFKIGDNPEDFENPIFLTKYTNPGNVDYMLKSKCIITEIGGIYSHAAVLAQKFKIPAMVGMGFIDSDYESGDKVEVNTETGKITKLN